MAAMVDKDAVKNLRLRIEFLPDFRARAPVLGTSPAWYLSLINEVAYLAGGDAIKYLTGRMDDSTAVLFAATDRMVIGASKTLDGPVAAISAEAAPLYRFRRVSIEGLDVQGEQLAPAHTVRYRIVVGDSQFVFPLGQVPDGDSASEFLKKLLALDFRT
jgi:hypothetical protein